MADLYPVDPQWAKGSHCDNAKYLEMYQRSVTDPDGFWAEMAERLDWIKKPTRIKNTSFEGIEMTEQAQAGHGRENGQVTVDERLAALTCRPDQRVQLLGAASVDALVRVLPKNGGSAAESLNHAD